MAKPRDVEIAKPRLQRRNPPHRSGCLIVVVVRALDRNQRIRVAVIHDDFAAAIPEMGYIELVRGEVARICCISHDRNTVVILPPVPSRIVEEKHLDILLPPWIWSSLTEQHAPKILAPQWQTREQKLPVHHII